MVQTINSLGLRQPRRRTIGAVCHVESDVTEKGATTPPFLQLKLLPRTDVWSVAVNSSDPSTEASRWLVELQTTDCLDDVWDEFDAWFQASPTHKAAYAQAQRHWLELAGLPTPPTRSRAVWTSERRGVRYIAQLRSVCAAHWELIFAALLAVLISHNT